jgi:glycosyltransferase involved in cell wall biosynthesis
MTNVPLQVVRTDAPRFSVNMNVFNGEAYLRAAIDSVLAQTFQDWELIIWDDCSTDGSVALCASYDDPRIRLFIAEANTGLGTARNRAMAMARGDWVAFLDQDDVWTPDKLAGQDALIRADQSGRLALLYGRARRFDDSGPTGPFDLWYGTGRLPEGDIMDALLARPSFIPNSAVVFKRSVLMTLLPMPARVRFCTDYYLCMMIARDHTVACLQSLCCHYRVHPGSMTQVFRREVHEEILLIMELTARPSDRHILRVRRRVHQTWIGVAEFRDGERRQGITRIIRRGSLAYLVLRPLVRGLRRLRDRVGNGMRPA